MKQARIAIFASGKGTNARRIIEHFLSHPTIKICLILTNNPQAGVIEVGRKYNIPVVILNKQELYDSNSITDILENEKISHVVLAGFLWLIPESIIHGFPNAVVNIHPALLPKFGGKGMYGNYVHQAVKLAGETQTGITVHLVNEKYDDGEYIQQEKVSIHPEDTVETIAKKVQELEHQHYPIIIENWIQKTYLDKVV